MNLIDEAESLLLHQFQKSPKLKALIRSLVAPLQELADQLYSLHDGKYIEEAYGERLDILGRLVDQPRKGMSDVEYRLWLKVRICLNNSHGTPKDVLKILSILLEKDSFLMDERWPNDVLFTFLEAPKAPLKHLLHIIKASIPLNTCCHFLAADKKPLFRFDSGNGFGSGHLADYYEELLV